MESELTHKKAEETPPVPEPSPAVSHSVPDGDTGLIVGSGTPSPVPDPPLAATDPNPAPADPPAAASPIPPDEKLTFVKGKTHRTIVRHEGLEAQQMALDTLAHCTVKLFGLTDSVMVDDCTDCTFLIGPCTGSIMFRNCARLHVTCACGQLRTRDCRDVQFFLYCKSDPVVETSTDVRFQTWNVAYPGLVALFAEAGFAPHKNRYRNVFDFNKDDPAVPEPHFLIQPVGDSLPLREEDLTDAQGRRIEGGPPEIPEALLQVMRGELAPPVGKGFDGDRGPLSHLDIRAGPAPAQHLLQQVETATAPPADVVVTTPIPHLVVTSSLPLEKQYDEAFDVDDEQDVSSEAGAAPPSPTPPLPSPPTTGGYVPRYAMATAEYRADVRRVAELEERVRQLQQMVRDKTHALDALLQTLEPP